jgi:hypothetical protein
MNSIEQPGFHPNAPPDARERSILQPKKRREKRRVVSAQYGALPYRFTQAAALAMNGARGDQFDVDSEEWRKQFWGNGVNTADTTAKPNGADGNWGEPDLGVLRLRRRPPPALPLEVFGETWKKWLIDAAKAAACPVDYVVAPLLASVSTLIGNARWAQAWPGWSEPPHLWTVAVGDSGTGKSPGADVDARRAPNDRATNDRRLSRSSARMATGPAKELHRAERTLYSFGDDEVGIRIVFREADRPAVNHAAAFALVFFRERGLAAAVTAQIGQVYANLLAGHVDIGADRQRCRPCPRAGALVLRRRREAERP